MRNFIIFILALLPLLAHAENKVGFSTLSIEHDSRPLNGHVWHPTSDDSVEESLASNIVWQGFRGIKEATIETGKHPLVLLSHGLYGNSFNLSWLAASLVQQGYVVAAINHPGTSTFDRDWSSAQMLWERPKDISRTVDYLLGEHAFSPYIDASNISVIGHSLGGFTAMGLAGARYDLKQHSMHCQQYPQRADCRFFDSLKLQELDENKVSLSASWQDKRIQKAVSLDLGGAQGFTTESLAAIETPVLIIGAAWLNILNLDAESRYIEKHMKPNVASYREFSGVNHFDFFGLCKDGAEELLAEEEPGDEIVCLKGQGVRAEKHDRIFDTIMLFLEAA